MLRERLQSAVDRFHHLTDLLSDPAIISDNQKFRELSQERSSLEKLVELADVYGKVLDQLSDNEELSQSSGELAEMAREEIPGLKAQVEKLEQQIKLELLPKDPDEGKNILLEIRAGAGGEEASLFAADLFRAYTKFAQGLGFRVEILSESFADMGGYKEVVASLEGPEVYRFFKYESGVHRVQRIPSTEANGRIHTSTVTVAIMAEATEQEIHIDEKDLRVDVFRASGKGGQGVNRTESAVRIVHLPTNTVVQCQDERSQIKNKERAMKVLRARLLAVQVEQAEKARADQRRAQVGTGDRSERIRTYNFPQERVTDHRVGLTLKQLSMVMEGKFDEIVEALQQEDYSKRLAESMKA
jgi:peptide chain release factor 1